MTEEVKEQLRHQNKQYALEVATKLKNENTTAKELVQSAKLIEVYLNEGLETS